jgi:hypothetical protein
VVHLIFATCMPWLRNVFAALDVYSCNRCAVVSQYARHFFAKHLPMRPLVHRSYSALRGCFSATAQSSLCIVFAKIWNCICCELLQLVSNTFAIFTPRFHSQQRPILIEPLQHVFYSFATKMSLSCNISASKIQRLQNRG